MSEKPPAPNSIPFRSSAKRPGSFLFSILTGVIAFIAIVVFAEAAFHNSAVEKRIPLRSLGSFHAQFEIKWFKLEDYVRQNGGVDVILLGNSMVNTGIDPAVMAEEYQARTGKRLRIFNFGVEGLTIAPLSDLARILADRYHPGTILLFTEMRDYVAANGLAVENQFRADAWMRGQLGNASLKGMLIDRSLLLQHLLPLRNWSRADFIDHFFMDLRRFDETSASGYEADRNIGENIEQAPNPNDPNEKLNFELFSNFHMDASRIQDLEKILALKDQGVTALVTEIPVYPTYYVYFGGESVHQEYLKELSQILGGASDQFLPAIPDILIPISGRADNHHLNYEGAPLYSTLRAQSLADLCKQQSICLNPSGGSQP